MAERKTKARKVRRCKCCGEVLPRVNIYLCDACQEAGMGRKNNANTIAAQELLEIATQREMVGQNPITGMDMAQIDLLARCFLPPYSTYGRFKGYVQATGKLPPREFCKETD